MSVVVECDSDIKIRIADGQTNFTLCVYMPTYAYMRV